MRKAIAIALLAIASIASLAAFANRGNGGAVRGAAARAGMMAAQMVEVEYLESTGTQYIDTRIFPDNNTISTVVAMEIDTTHGFYFGVRSAWKVAMYGVAVNSSYGMVEDEWGNGSINITGYSSTIAQFNQWSIGPQLKLNGNTIVTATENTFSSAYSVYLFAFNNAGFPYRGTMKRMRIKSFKSERIGIVLIDLIPVRVGSVGYMYDRVSGKLFGNAGTGAFIVGPDK